MMMLRARYRADGTIESVSLEGGEFEREAEWDRAVFDAADPRFLKLDGDTITLTVDQGTATYRVIGPGREPDTLLTLLESVIRPDGTRDEVTEA